MTAIFKRELKAYFTSPIGWIFIGVFAFIYGFYFNQYVIELGFGDISNPLASGLLILVLLVPVLTMRLIAEERGSRTDQLLLTSPVSVTSIVLGKLFAALCVFLCAVATTLPYLAIIAVHGSPLWGKILGTYLGYFMLGLCFISIGIFFSSITESQIIALVVSLGVLLMFFLMSNLPSVGIGLLDKAIALVSVTEHFEDFVIGVLKLENIFYYLSFSVLFIFLTVRSVEKRRWAN